MTGLFGGVPALDAVVSPLSEGAAIPTSLFAALGGVGDLPMDTGVGFRAQSIEVGEGASSAVGAFDAVD